MIHGEFETTAPAGHLSGRPSSTAFEDAGHRGRERPAARSTLVIPLTVAFGNPDLLDAASASAPVLQSLGAEREYKNDEQIDNSLRSVLFQVPQAGHRRTRTVCGAPGRRPGLLLGRPGPRRDRRRARPRPRHADLQRPARARTGCAASTRSRRSPASAPIASRATLQSTGRPDRRSEHPRLRRAARQERAHDRAGEPGSGGRRRHRRPPDDARGATEGDLRQRRQGRRVRRHGLRAPRLRHRSSASCSSRSGGGSSRRCATATASSTSTTPRCC